jgi:hypothetical protein
MAIAPRAPAGVVVYIDADPSTAAGLGGTGIESTRTVTAGQNITVDVVIELETAADSLSIYGATVRFDNLELELNGAPTENDPALVDLGNPLSPFITGGLSATDDRPPSGKTGTDDGEVGSFEAWHVSLSAVGPRIWVAGSIPLTVLTPLDDGVVDVRPGVFTGLDGLYNSATLLVTGTFNGATLVPEPSVFAGLAVTLGLCGLGIYWRRRHAVG